MRKYLLSPLVALLLTSCGPTEEQAKSAEYRYFAALDQLHKLTAQNTILDKEIATKSIILKHLNNGTEPKYVVTIKMAVSRVSLDIWEHVADASNAGTFTIPVSKEFYDNVKEGDKLADSFRAGSFILKGSLSSWNISIVGKHIE